MQLGVAPIAQNACPQSVRAAALLAKFRRRSWVVLDLYGPGITISQGESTVYRINMGVLRAAFAFCLAASLSACMTTRVYVDPALPTVGREDVGSTETPMPVQLAAEFRTKGSSNASATALMRPRALAVLNESGLFSRATEAAVEQGGRLVLVIDNVPLTDNAAAKGFGTGLTLGAVGSMVSDGYQASLVYTRNGATHEVAVKHAIHTTVGNHAGPEGLTPMTMDAAVYQMIDQIVWNGLKLLNAQGAFE